jgi:hypothetical protein
MVARLLGDLPRLFYFLVVANVQVLHHILAMGRLPIEPSVPKVIRFGGSPRVGPPRPILNNQPVIGDQHWTTTGGYVIGYRVCDL